MARKPFTLRQAVLTGAAIAAGSVAGVLAETIIIDVPGIGPLATATVALWVLDKLNALVDDA